MSFRNQRRHAKLIDAVTLFPADQQSRSPALIASIFAHREFIVSRLSRRIEARFLVGALSLARRGSRQKRSWHAGDIIDGRSASAPSPASLPCARGFSRLGFSEDAVIYRRRHRGRDIIVGSISPIGLIRQSSPMLHIGAGISSAPGSGDRIPNERAAAAAFSFSAPVVFGASGAAVAAWRIASRDRIRRR